MLHEILQASSLESLHWKSSETRAARIDSTDVCENLSIAKFQHELTYVTPVVFINLDGTENYCLVSQWVGTESCNSSDNGNLTSAQLC